MGSLYLRKKQRLKRKKRIRKKIFGTTERLRLSVFRSSRHIYAQLIDDTCGKTIVAASSMEKELRKSFTSEKKIVVANMVGKLIGERAKEKGIKHVVFDRNGFLYHGRVKAVSEGAREVGLDF